jgi:hypothetical protein
MEAFEFAKIDDLLEWGKDRGKITLNDIKELISYFNPLNVFISYELDETETIKCFILSPINRYIATPFENSCNGIVIDATEWRILAMHPRNLYVKPMTKIIDLELAKHSYNIYDVIDGTVITLYCWNDVWRISTVNGYDVSNYKWMCDQTFQEIFAKMIKKFLGKTLDEFYSLLDKSYNYSIGFRCHDHHPLLTDPEKLWLVQVCNGMTLLNINDFVVITGIMAQPSFTTQVFESVKDIETYLSDSIEKAKSKVYIYGVILRAKEKATCDIIIESPFLKQIRHLMYNKLPNAILKHVDFQSMVKVRVMIAAIRQEKVKFLVLFGQFKELFQTYEKFIKQVTSAVSIQLRSDKITSRGVTDEVGDSSYQTLIFAICNQIKKTHDQFQPFSAWTANFVGDTIRNIVYAPAFVKTIDKINFT